jgi:anti-anti-sigma factor
VDIVSDAGKPLNSVDVSVDDAGVLVVRIAGELDLSAIPELEAAVEPALAAKPRGLIVDVSGLRFADSSAIALWVRWALATPQFELRDPPAFVKRVLAAMGLSERLGVRG